MAGPLDSLRLSRRSFLAAAAMPLVAGACRRRELPYDAARFSLPDSSGVGLFPAASYAIDLADVVSRGIREMGLDVARRRVFLKPNMVEYEPGTSINTHPALVAGAVAAFRRAGASEVVVGEGPGHRRDIEYLVESTGLGERLRDDRIRFVDLNHDDVQVMPLGSRFTGLPSIALPKTLLQADVIVSMPKLKTHHWAGMTCSLKNFFGTVPGAVYGWPKNVLHVHGIDNSIVDLAATIRPHFTIVDAITAMEGDGPILGKPRAMGFIAMGTDLVAVDATCARVIGLDPMKIEYLRAASEFLGNVDTGRITHRGEPLSRYATTFEVIPDLVHLRAA